MNMTREIVSTRFPTSIHRSQEKIQSPRYIRIGSFQLFVICITRICESVDTGIRTTIENVDDDRRSDFSKISLLARCYLHRSVRSVQLILSCVLLEQRSSSRRSGSRVDRLKISVTYFSFRHGFRMEVYPHTPYPNTNLHR